MQIVSTFGGLPFHAHWAWRRFSNRALFFASWLNDGRHCLVILSAAGLCAFVCAEGSQLAARSGEVHVWSRNVSPGGESSLK